MRGKRLTVWGSLIVAVVLLLSGGPATAQGFPPAAGNVGGDSVGAQAILYNQLTIGPGNGGVSQNFEPALNSADNQAADDFSVPSGNFFWSVNQIEVDGFYVTSGYQATSVNVFFYNHNPAGSLPGTSFYSGSFVPSSGLSTGAFNVSLFPPAGLLAGKTYWVSIQANLDSASASPAHQWLWRFRTSLTGVRAAWINPGDGYGTGCITWGALGPCTTGGSDVDLQFQLSGSQINIASRVYLPIVYRNP